MSDDLALRQAAEHIFLSGIGDTAEALCRSNMTYGIAKIRHAEQVLGLAPQAMFIGAPDATVTRNRYRWRQGFGYGGQVRWNPELAVLDSKPNGCGMLVAATERAVEEDAVRAALRRTREAPLRLDGVPLQYDLAESNHFVDVLELEQRLDAPTPVSLPKHLVVLHSSGSEHRPRSPFGPGLYVDESVELQRMARRIETPWGALHVLMGAQAHAYYDFCRQVQRFNRRRRALYARELFGELRLLCNATHQGMRAPGVFHLGAYWFESDAQLFPLTLGPDHPVYLLRPRPNFSRRAMDHLGWTSRAERLGLASLLTQANLLPHGGGYAFPQLEALLSSTHRDGQAHFRVQRSDDGLCEELGDVRDLPFGYRGAEVLRRLQDLELATPVARYHIRFVLKE